MSVWLWVVVAFLAGGLIGAGITALLKRTSDVEQRLRRLRREHEQYQAEVARHFSQTGELLSRLRTAFDQLYNEVEDRATALVAEEAVQRRLNYLDNGGPPSGSQPRERPASPQRLGDDRTATPGFGGERPRGEARSDERPDQEGQDQGSGQAGGAPRQDDAPDAGGPEGGRSDDERRP